MARFIIPHTPPTTNKTVRMPNDLIQAVEEIIAGRECTFTAFVNEAVRVAVQTVREEEEG